MFDIEKLFDNAKILSAKYIEELFTYEFIVLYNGSTAQQVLLFNKKNFPNSEAFKILDESVQVHEDVKVLLKSEAELKLSGWQFAKYKKQLKSKESPFIVGDKKKKMLGNLYSAKVGITEDYKPFIFIDKYRFSPAEIKCIIRSNDLNELPVSRLKKPPKTLSKMYMSGEYFYDSIGKQLYLPGTSFIGQSINDLKDFLILSGLM